MNKKALITGITGQDGSYLAELLLAKGYEVHGVVRRVALENPEERLHRLKAVLPYLELHSGTLENFASVYRILRTVQPEECYHLAAQSFVSYSFEDEFSTLGANAGGTHHVLASLRETAPDCRFYFAATSEMFGKVRETPQTEWTPFHPRSAYGISKVTGFELTRNYREAYGIHASSGILFNHESPRRGFEFVTRKISRSVARIRAGLDRKLHLGNLAAKRDWGHARDYVEAMWLMLQQENPDDYVIATGETHSVGEFVELAFASAGLRWEDHVVVDPQLFRPAEVDLLMGCPDKARGTLGWRNRVSFPELVTEMVEADCQALQTGEHGAPRITAPEDFSLAGVARGMAAPELPAVGA